MTTFEFWTVLRKILEVRVSFSGNMIKVGEAEC